MTTGEEIYYGQLSNGIRWIFVPSPGRLAHAALMFSCGSRNENENETGLAHFVEHNLFKGTRTKSSLQVLSRIDSVGGELNAYTAKEETCIYASFFPEYLDRAVELLGDIGFQSVFPGDEVAKEKKVILDEIMTYEDNPSEQIFDEFDELLFGKHPIGKNILGTRETVKGFRRSDILTFTSAHYLTSSAVLAVSGPYTLAAFKKSIEKNLGHHHTSGNRKALTKPSLKKKVTRKRHKEIQQDYVLMGGGAPSLKHDSERIPMVLLNNLLGGPSLNNRLNLAIREKYGLTYSLESGYHAYSDCGIFSVFFATDAGNTEKTASLVRAELNKLTKKPLSQKQLDSAKMQLFGNLAMMSENRQNATIAMAKCILVFGKYEDMDTVFAKIKKITAEQVMETAQKFFNHDSFCTLHYQSKHI